MGDSGYERTTRERYDHFAGEYFERFRDSMRERTFDRSMIAAFTELVLASGNPRVLDIGCGPGYVTDHLAGLGLEARGVDLSPEMIALAREAYPDLEFATGEMTAVDLPDGTLGGMLSRSSIIHTPPEALPGVFKEWLRLLTPGGHLLLIFQAHTDTSQLAWAFDHSVTTAYRLSVGRVADLLAEAGFQEVVRQVVAAEEDEIRGFHCGYLLVRKPGGTTA
ncbi:class I SAM-dependent DNA methyltransferase [Glycomyces algeriensis]|uniref:Methyltransferase n=1 Tax=Glycomyces algeriensis TaxID=256037 RepID=A0A9W6LIH1_9ACTN|nr:class I SAM-dependent methyltransferase [Glycomyces algeriensis]MDA1368238.1 class I SAM-dependent methyltransferase [Glycomyces algeriensis]MDR7351878.1 SAM-dependent methyltransferase [Glycomyces algeriensis]GLI44608.1 methyltransferase [Glycomyces algeriensis]